MNDDNRNMILAIVLSRARAVRLELGQPAISSRPPIRRRPRSRSGKPGRAAAAAMPAPRRQRPRRSATARVVLGESAARSTIETPRLSGSINLNGARIDDLVLTAYRETHRARFAAGPPVLAGGHARRLFRELRLDRPAASPPPASPTRVLDRDARRQRHAHPGDAGHAHLEQRPGPDLRDPPRGRRTITCSRPSRRVANAARRRSRARALALVSRVGADPRSRQLDRSISARSACSTAPPITTYNFKNVADAGTRQFRQPWRLARLHRQILAGRARSRSGRLGPVELPARRAGDAYQADFCDAAGQSSRRARRCSTTPRSSPAPRKSRLLDDYEDSLGTASSSRAIDWGWFRWFDEADLLAARTGCSP